MTNRMKSIGKSSILFLLVALSVWIKCRWFSTWCLSFLSINYDYSPIAQNLAIVSMAIALASLVWISKRPFVSIGVLIVVDLWIIANIIYFRANHLLITYSAIAMSSNLSGFEQAIFSYLDWHIILIPITTLTLIVIYVTLSPTKRYPCVFSGALLISCICSLIASDIRCQHRGVHTPWLVEQPIVWSQKYNPFRTPDNLMPEQWKLELKDLNYTYHHSIVAYGINVLTEGRSLYKDLVSSQQDVMFTEEDHQILNRVAPTPFDVAESESQNKGNLLIIIVESLESWVFDYKDNNGAYVMPRIQKIMNEHPYLFANKVVPQIRHGVSADGQLIINTGLLPLIDGAACLLYADNSYPNLAHFYGHSANFDACSRAWNGNATSKAYCYQQHVAPKDESWWMENVTAPMAKEYFVNHKQSTCAQIVTIASHSPFTAIYDMSEPIYSFDFSDNVDEMSTRYLQSINWMDRYIGDLLLYLESDGLFDNTTIVITGDHTYHRENEYYCPLLIFSPSLHQTNVIKDQVYQMDIYPTILSLIGQSEYGWRGVGIDLSKDSRIRSIQPDEALYLSDKLIRANYFASQHD